MKGTLDNFSGSESYPMIPLIVGRKMRVKSIFDGQESKVSYHGTRLTNTSVYHIP